MAVKNKKKNKCGGKKKRDGSNYGSKKGIRTKCTLSQGDSKHCDLRPGYPRDTLGQH